MYPFFSSSSRNSFSVFVSFEFKGYILQLILVGAPSNHSIAISSRHFGGNLWARFLLNTFQCFWYSLGSSFLGASSFFSRALCAHTCAVVVFWAWIVCPHLWCWSILVHSTIFCQIAICLRVSMVTCPFNWAVLQSMSRLKYHRNGYPRIILSLGGFKVEKFWPIIHPH